MEIGEEAITVPAFGDLAVTHLIFGGLSARQRIALDRFLALGPEAVTEATPHLDAYYRDIRAVDGPDQIDPHVPPPSAPGDLWAFTSLDTVIVEADPDGVLDGYVSLSGGCEWEVEHGLNLVWKDGTELVKVGPVDGHVTNARAYDDLSLETVVYKALDPARSTRRDV